MKNKRGAMGEGLMMIYRLVLISFIALIVLGISAVFYDYNVKVYDVEARILGREIALCLSMGDEAVVEKGKLFNYCGIKINEDEFYVKANVGGKVYEQGDSGASWVKKAFKENSKYYPGYYNYNFTGGRRSVNVEVYAYYE